MGLKKTFHRWLDSRLARDGLAIRPRAVLPDDGGLFELWRYTGADGAFSYEAYRAAQVAANRRKLDKVWAQPENIAFLADHVRRHVAQPRFGLCHGTRRGLEQQWFREALGCEVIGTEISETASQFPHTIQWDFHDVKPEWEGAADFVYSNSFDHSYDPEACLRAWMRCVRPGGSCIIEHSHEDGYAKESDPFGAPLVAMPYLVLRWGRGAFAVHEILEAPVAARFAPGVEHRVWFLIIRHNS
jgi:SAM-dependent methyltransferase